MMTGENVKNFWLKAGDNFIITRLSVNALQFQMNLLKFFVAAFSVVMSIAAVSPSIVSAQGDRYGTLAIDENNGDQYGWAIDYETRAEADARALRECGQNCHIVLQFAGGCGAYAVERGNPTLYGWGTASTRVAAESRALSEARIRGGRDVLIRVWGCMAPRRDTANSEARLAEELARARERRAAERAAEDEAERQRLQRALDSAKQRRAAEAQDESRRGILKGRVTDALTRNGIGGASVIVSSGEHTIDVTTSTDGSYTTPSMPAGTYSVAAVADRYQPATLFGARVTAVQTSTAASIPLVPASNQPGVISGVVRNARNARPMSAVPVEIRNGVGSVSGETVGATLTNANGSYRFGNLPAGTYSVAASYAGFVNGSLTGISVGGSERANQDVLLSPEGSENEIRIVLSWGSDPADLDSHLYGPGESGSRFHIAYNSRGSLDGGTFAALDVDDRSSYGPETVTITQQRPGAYRYAVHHFAGAGTLSSSGAVVQVYRGSTLLDRFEPPYGSDGKGDVWIVFELDATSLRPINSISRQFPQ
jgi:hypothetical protein